MGFLKNLFSGFKKLGMDEIDVAVEEIFATNYKVSKGVEIKNIYPDYAYKHGYVCDYVIGDMSGNVRWIIVKLPHNSEKYDDYKQLVELCKNKRVKLINFYMQFPNEKEYVQNRIRRMM